MRENPQLRDYFAGVDRDRDDGGDPHATWLAHGPDEETEGFEYEDGQR